MLVNTQIIAWQPWVTPSLLLPICSTHLGQDRKSLSFLTFSTLFPSSLLVACCFFFSVGLFWFFFSICNINLLVKVGDRWKAYLIIEIVRSKAIGCICHGWQFTANAGPGMHRWGVDEASRGVLMVVIRQGLIKRVRDGALGPFLGVRCLIPWSSGWGSCVMFSEAPESCWLLSPLFFLLSPEAWVPFICQKPARTSERWAEIMCLSKCQIPSGDVLPWGALLELLSSLLCRRF